MDEVAAVLVAGFILAAVAVSWMWREPARASIIERLERAMVSNQARQDAQDEEIDELRRQIVELREERIADHVLMQEWIAYARRLGALLREATGQEPPAEPAERTRVVSPSDLGRLANRIDNRFSIEEMNTLAFELGLEGAVTGDTSAARAASLVNVARRRGLLLRLIALCRAERPEGGF